MNSIWYELVLICIKMCKWLLEQELPTGISIYVG